MTYKIKHKSMNTLSATIPSTLPKCEKPSNILVNVPKIKILIIDLYATLNYTFKPY